MKRKNFMIALTLLTTGTAWAEDFPKDSLKIVDIEEVVVIATPKENRKLRELPVAATVLSQDNMRANQVNSVKNLTGIVPNLFIPRLWFQTDHFHLYPWNRLTYQHSVRRTLRRQHPLYRQIRFRLQLC